MPELKVTSAHLERDAYLYIRQSTPRQVVENVESTQRQYALRDRAVAQGWPLERIHVIDCDLGKSAAHCLEVFTTSRLRSHSRRRYCFGFMPRGMAISFCRPCCALWYSR